MRSQLAITCRQLVNLAAAHAIAAIVAEVAVAIPDCDCSTVVTCRGVLLEGCKLLASGCGTFPRHW
jgi:hypothetical protein